MSAQSHQSEPRVLNRRTLQRDHAHLATLLKPGQSVLDIGCGPGAITAGIAAVVGPQGSVLGLDRDAGLIALAQRDHGHIKQLTFQTGDVLALPATPKFDIVTAARTLQWIADPAAAVVKMAKATKPGGLVVALDYSHQRNHWLPDPPAAFRAFFGAFLAWREKNGWDNDLAQHLPDHFRAAGLVDVQSLAQEEAIDRSVEDFDERSTLWLDVIDTLGDKIVASKLLTAAKLEEARETYESWIDAKLLKQTLSLRVIVGRAR